MSGMRVFDWRTHEYMLYERDFGRSLRAHEIVSVALNEFLPLPTAASARDPRAIREEQLDDQPADAGGRNCVDANGGISDGTGESQADTTTSGQHANNEAAADADLRAVRRALVRRFLLKLHALLADYEQQREQHIVASSILLAYDYIAPGDRAAACRALDALSDSDAGADSSAGPNFNPNPNANSKPSASSSCASPGITKSCPAAELPDVVVRLIDFAHVDASDPPGSPDENVLYGIRNLIHYFESLLN